MKVFPINKPNIMKKSKYQQYFHCFIACILVPYASWLSYQWNMVTILISVAVIGAALVRGRRLFQCTYPKVRRLFEAQHLSQEIRYLTCLKTDKGKLQKQYLQTLFKKRVLINFANFTGKHLCWRLFLINFQVI